MKNSSTMLDIDMERSETPHVPVDIDLAEREAERERLFRNSHTPQDENAVRVVTIDGPMLTEDRTVRDLQEECWQTAENHGFHDVQTFAEKIALIHSELSEALEDFRDGKDPGETWYEQDGKKPCGIPSELADVFIRLADMAECYGVDLQGAIEEKMAYNKTRPFLHGKTL